MPDHGYNAPSAKPASVPASLPAHVDASRPTLEQLHDRFATELSSALRGSVSNGLQIRAGRAETVSYEHFIASRPSPTCLAVLKVDPPNAQICLELSPDVAYPMIDRLLGGFGETAKSMPRRAFTQIEQGLALQIIERAAAVLADTWSSVVALTVREDGLFTDPTQVRIMPGDESVTCVPFDITFNGQAGAMHLCIPSPVTDLLVGSSTAMAPLTAPPERDAKDLMDTAVELRAILAQTKLRLSEVLALNEGDIITTDVPLDSVIPLLLHDQAIRQGRLAQLDNHKVIEILDRRPDSSAGGQRSS